MAYKAKITQLTNLYPHPNADKVQLTNCYGNQIVVGIGQKEGDLGIYFPSDGQLSEEFCRNNNLYRDPNKNIDHSKSGFFDDNRRVRAQKFRGEISDGLWLPLNCLSYITEYDLNIVEQEFDSLGGHQICNKYVNKQTIEFAKTSKPIKTARKSIMFKEHFDTDHFGLNIDKFEVGDLVIITEKLHGTSGRVGYVKVDRKLSWFERILNMIGVGINRSEWKYLNGTRRVVLEESTTNQYHDPSIRQKAFELFENKLNKGETVYFEIVGFEPSGTPIMPAVTTKCLQDKFFTKRYGEQMYYSYGCSPKDCDIYVYRITMTNEDGFTIDYSWEDVIRRSNELGVKHVPVIISFILGDSLSISEHWEELIPYYASGHSFLDESHIKEGVCVRIEGGMYNKTFKYKSFEFKVLEGIIKDSGQIDQEEAQSF